MRLYIKYTHMNKKTIMLALFVALGAVATDKASAQQVNLPGIFGGTRGYVPGEFLAPVLNRAITRLFASRLKYTTTGTTLAVMDMIIAARVTKKDTRTECLPVSAKNMATVTGMMTAGMMMMTGTMTRDMVSQNMKMADITDN
jgi:hypothetical protein